MDSMIPLVDPDEPPTSDPTPKGPRRRRWIVPSIVALAIGTPAVVYRDAILAWWRGDEKGAAEEPLGADPTATQHVFSGRGRSAIEEALDAYDEARAALARDSHASVRAPSRQVADALERAARIESRAPRSVREALDEGLDAARALGQTDDLTGARTIFARLSNALIRLLAADARLTEGWRAYACPMVDGENRWIQHGTEKANPYMGTSMPSCGTETSFGDTHVHEPPPTSRTDASDVAYYTCPMHPSVRASSPGACPICGTTLTPVTHDALASGEIVVDDARRRRFGIRTALVERRTMRRTIRAPARVAVDVDRERVWVDARLYEDDIELAVVGLQATVIPALGSAPPRRGAVTYVDPSLDPQTRTGRARIELENAELDLRPGTYVDVVLEVDLGERLTVPDEAIVYTGPRRLVFVDRGDDRLVPRDVVVGVCAEQACEVTSGLSEGERIVRSGTFLVASESRVRSGSHDEATGHGAH